MRKQEKYIMLHDKSGEIGLAFINITRDCPFTEEEFIELLTSKDLNVQVHATKQTDKKSVEL